MSLCLSVHQGSLKSEELFKPKCVRQLNVPLLALVPHEVLVDSRKSGQQQWPVVRVNRAAYLSDACKRGLKVGQGELWCKRQLRDYKHANHLCFKCARYSTQTVSVARSGMQSCTWCTLKTCHKRHQMKWLGSSWTTRSINSCNGMHGLSWNFVIEGSGRESSIANTGRTTVSSMLPCWNKYNAHSKTLLLS
jgi:hypothetical protein